MMTMRDIDVPISKDAEAMLDLVTKFSMDVMRKAGIELDKMSSPEDVIAPDSVLWDVHKNFQELGLHTAQIPKHLDGTAGEVDPLASVLMIEQLGYADVGLAISLGVSARTFYLASMFPHPDMQQLARDYCEDKGAKMIGCWAITEPDHGSDWFLGGNCPQCGPSVKAVLKGDEYIINGEKSAWVSNGTIATHATLHVSLDPSRGMQGQGLAIIPLNLPGISRGKPLDKMGQRSLNQGSIIFQDVVIPKINMVVPLSDFINAAAVQGLSEVNGGMAILFSGLARAAFDEALRYAKERIQGGAPIFEHATIKQKLMKMFAATEAARAGARRMAIFNLKNPLSPSVTHAVAAKCFSTETATFVASEALQIFGGYGLAKEYPVEKMFRDARTGMIEDGCNDALAIKAAEFL
jgi:alkylation response protein AidB-like acyl-CoA dehydrogenase